MAGRDGFDEVADELYGLPLAEFTAARTAAVARAKQDGDAELARRIAELRKPVMAGWIANQLVRAYPGEVASLVDLGASLRDAMRRLDGDELRQAAGRQQQAVYALVQRAEGLAAQGISAEARRGLEQTLHAALVDPGVAGALVAGRLTGPLSRSGFPDIVVGDLAQAQPATNRAAATVPKSAPKRSESVDEDEQARAEVEAAAQAYAQAQQKVEEREQTARAAKDKVERLNEDLETALGEQHRAEADLRTARREARFAEQAARRAAQRLPR